MRTPGYVFLVSVGGVAEAAVDDDGWPRVAAEAGRHEGDVTVEVIRNTAADQWPVGRRPACPVCRMRRGRVVVPTDAVGAFSPTFAVQCANCDYVTVSCASILDAWAEWYANALRADRRVIAA